MANHQLHLAQQCTFVGLESKTFYVKIVERILRNGYLCTMIDYSADRYCVLYPVQNLEEGDQLRTILLPLGDEIFPREITVGKFMYQELDHNNPTIVDGGYAVMAVLPGQNHITFEEWVEQWKKRDKYERWQQGYVTGATGWNIDFHDNVKGVLRGIKQGADKIHAYEKCNPFLLQCIRITPDNKVIFIPWLEEESVLGYKSAIKALKYTIEAIVQSLGYPETENTRIFNLLVKKALSADRDPIRLFRQYTKIVFGSPLLWIVDERENFTTGAGDAYGTEGDNLRKYQYNGEEVNFNDWYSIVPKVGVFANVYNYTTYVGGPINEVYTEPSGIIWYRRNSGEHREHYTKREIEEMFFCIWPQFCSVVHYYLASKYIKAKHRKAVTDLQYKLLQIKKLKEEKKEKADASEPS